MLVDGYSAIVSLQERTMLSEADVLVHLYDAFNRRDIDAALAAMHEDIVWANGLDGGHVTGHAGVRAYWTRQWATINSHAEPTGFSIGADGAIQVEVRLTARDLDGNLLFDTMGRHAFSIVNGRVKRFDIR